MSFARVATFGEALGLATNIIPGTIVGSRLHTMGFGGAETNVAIALTRLGVPVTWFSRLGTDPFGDLILRELRAEGVDTRVTRDSTRPTGFMLKQRRNASVASVSYWRRGSAATRLAAAEIDDDTIAGAAILHITGITPGLSPIARETTLDVVRRARRLGTLVSFDVNHREGVWPAKRAAPMYRLLASLSDIVFAGQDEARLISDARDPSALARDIAQLGPAEVLIKQAEEGAIADIDGVFMKQPARRVTVVDSVGAGDSFVAGYLSSRLSGALPADRLLRAVTLGALACTSHGDWESSPRLEELDRLFASEGTTR